MQAPFVTATVTFTSMSTTTGTANFAVGDETYKTWYKVLGNLKSGVRPLVLLHGGPGIPHHGLLGHDELFKAHSIPVVWYDQLGCGSSTHLPHKGEDFWTPRLFMDELENLVKHLGIADSFDLLGHSWGGMLAAQWAATRHPAGLNRIVLADTPAAMHLWDESSAILLPQMPLELRDTIKRGEESGDLDDPAYKAAMHAYYGMFCCRCNPWPEEATISHVEMARDPTVYNVMYAIYLISSHLCFLTASVLGLVQMSFTSAVH